MKKIDVGGKTKDAVQILRRRCPGKMGVPIGIAGSAHTEIAQLLCAVRKQRGLTQAQLAKLVGTNQSLVSYYENVDYQGHTISMLVRIAYALDYRLGVCLWRPSDGARCEV